MIVGGWAFVAWAYGIAYGSLIAYGLHLWHRIDRPTPGDENEQP